MNLKKKALIVTLLIAIFPKVLFAENSSPKITGNANNALVVENTPALTTESLSVASQIRINGVNVGENGMRIIDNANLACNFEITNNSTAPQKTSVILSTYTETKTLYKVKIITTPLLAPGNTENIQFSYTFNSEKEHSGKLMFWNNGIVPFRTAIDFTQAGGVNAYYYNADNRLLQVDKANDISIYYTYDNMGNLLTKTVKGVE